MPALGDCKICSHPKLSEIQEALENNPIVNIPAMFGDSFTRQTLYNHINNCLESDTFYFVEKHKLKAIADIENRFNSILVIAQETLHAARETLLVDGVINFNPRAHEVKIVYEHPYLKDEKGKPIVMTETLEEICLMLNQEAGFKVKRTILKLEDSRKTLREALSSCESILNNMARIFKQREENPTHQTYDRIRSMLESVAIKNNRPFLTELYYFDQSVGRTLKPEIQELIKAELAGIGDAIPQGMPETEAHYSTPLDASPTHLLSPMPITGNVDEKNVGEIFLEKSQETESVKNMGENFSEKSEGEKS